MLTYHGVERLLSSVGDKYLLLLLTEPTGISPQTAKPGIPSLSYRVLDVLTEQGGQLDDSLSNWAKQRPSRLLYRRLEIDRSDAKLMTRIGVCWLPQIRLVKKGRTLFRSSVSVGDNGEFLAQDVGGKSFLRRVEPSLGGYINLLDALSAEIDRKPAF